MKTWIPYYLRILLLLLTLAAPASQVYAQVTPYKIVGEEVVFNFDIRRYADALKQANGNQVDFSDIKIYDVAISGNFNNWNVDGWKMKKTGEFQYELRKMLNDFNDAFPPEFKYIINGRYIADPDATNSRQFSDDFLEQVYSLDLSVIRVNEKGNVVFRLEGFQQKQQVILAGSFNGWDEKTLKMNRVAGGWELHADLPPGRYEYKFIADGTWLHDPVAKENVINEHNTLNSVLFVTVPVDFKLAGFPQAKKVILTGSFVDWNEQKIKMKLENGYWVASLPLEGGKHHYKFIIDGHWITDPSNPIIEKDVSGNLNSVLFIH